MEAARKSDEAKEARGPTACCRRRRTRSEAEGIVVATAEAIPSTLPAPEQAIPAKAPSPTSSANHPGVAAGNAVASKGGGIVDLHRAG